MPHDVVNVVGSRAGAKLGGVAADNLVPLALLKGPDGTGEQASADEIQQAGRRDEEVLQLRR